MNLDQFRSRPLVVTVKELCPCCNELKVGVKKQPIRDPEAGAATYCDECYAANKSMYVDEDYYAW
jgi:hypothetical protein